MGARLYAKAYFGAGSCARPRGSLTRLLGLPEHSGVGPSASQPPAWALLCVGFQTRPRANSPILGRRSSCVAGGDPRSRCRGPPRGRTRLVYKLTGSVVPRTHLRGRLRSSVIIRASGCPWTRRNSRQSRIDSTTSLLTVVPRRARRCRGFIPRLPAVSWPYSYYSLHRHSGNAPTVSSRVVRHVVQIRHTHLDATRKHFRPHAGSCLPQ
jgi:hypothetical protein